MQIFMCKGFTGEILKMEINPESSLENQMSSFVCKLYGENPAVSPFVLFNVTRGFEYCPKETFKENTLENDLLLLVNSHNIPSC